MCVFAQISCDNMCIADNYRLFAVCYNFFTGSKFFI